MPIEWPWKRWARERRKHEEDLKWLNGQHRALETGEEIEPPSVLTYALDHQAHHRGRTTIYLRLKGVTPPPEPQHISYAICPVKYGIWHLTLRFTWRYFERDRSSVSSQIVTGPEL
jgi:DinB family